MAVSTPATPLPAAPTAAPGAAASSLPLPSRPSFAPGRQRRVERAALAATVLVGFAFNAWALSNNGFGNAYYAAATRSMTRNWSNFFFVSFDPGGFISIDKPPVALWIEALSARVFGYNAWSLLLPSALAGAASVALLWSAIRRWFGPVAASVAALALALSPINVAVNRLNLPEPFMILFLVGAVWAVGRALDDRDERSDGKSWRWLVLAGALVGLAFNTKMLAAFVPVPALGLAVLVGTRGGWWPRLRRSALFGVAALLFSLPWLVIVDLVPASARPYVGGSTNDTVQQLVFGYNGLNRVTGNGQGGGGRFGGGAGGVFGGAAGRDRLFSPALAGQIAWLIPLAVLGLGVAAWRYRRRPAPLALVALWGGWSLLYAWVFSTAEGIFHAYYVSALAPGIAALVGIGAGVLVERLRGEGGARRQWWALGALAALALTIWIHVDISRRAPSFFDWTRPVAVALTFAATAALLVAVLRHLRWTLVAPALGIALTAVLITPAAWAASEANNSTLNTTLPQAGPRRGAAGSTFGSARYDADTQLASFLAKNNAGERWDLVVSSAMWGSDLIASHDLSVMALGGFLGIDRATTVADFARDVDAGEVRYVLVGTLFGGPVTSAPITGPAVRSRVGTPPVNTSGLPGHLGTTTGGTGLGTTNGPGLGGTGLGGPGTTGTTLPHRTVLDPGPGRDPAHVILQAVEDACQPVGAAAPQGYQRSLYDCRGDGAALAALGSPAYATN
jgi:4-amino-4-deoxy-L-arabinose transferase-like glycosyltransferase